MTRGLGGWAIILVTGALALSEPGIASTITPIADGRQVHVHGDFPVPNPDWFPGSPDPEFIYVYSEETFTPSEPFATFDQAPSQVSSVSSSGIAATANVTGYDNMWDVPPAGWRTETSTLDITFTVDEPGDFFLSGYIWSYYGDVMDLLSLTGPAGTEFLLDLGDVDGHYTEEDALDFSWQGWLTADEYRLQAIAEAGPNDTPEAGFHLVFAPVPEPSTALLLAAGLIGLASGKRG